MRSGAAAIMPTPEGLDPWVCHSKHKLCEGLENKEIPLRFNFRGKVEFCPLQTTEAGCKPLRFRLSSVAHPNLHTFLVGILPKYIFKNQAPPCTFCICSLKFLMRSLIHCKTKCTFQHMVQSHYSKLIHGQATSASPGCLLEMKTPESFPSPKSESAF